MRAEIPRPHYTVSYAGEAIWSLRRAADALEKVNPADPYWTIDCQLWQRDRKVGPRRRVYP